MVNKIEEFLNEHFGDVRATKDENGIIWFVAKDVADVLGYRMASDMTRLLEDEDVDTQTMRTLSGEQEMNIISESGVYDVVSSITKRNKERYKLAREFKRWIVCTVLPTIRQTGAYIEKEREEEVVDKYFYGLRDETKLIVFKELQSNNEKLQVKAGKFDKFMGTESTYTFTKVAKMLATQASEEAGKEIKITVQKLTSFLRESGILSKNKSGDSYDNLPNKGYEDYFDVVSISVKDKFNKSQTRVKPNGIDFIYDKLIEEYIS